MSEHQEIEILVEQVRTALDFAQQRLQEERVGLILEKVDLELSVQITSKKEAGGKINWGVSIDVSASTQAKRKSVLSISLVPKKPVRLGKRETDELGDAILALASSAAAAVKAGLPDLALAGANLTLEIVQSKEGKLQVVAGPSGGTENTHTIKLRFGPG
jgi:hypothetical protein